MMYIGYRIRKRFAVLLSGPSKYRLPLEKTVLYLTLLLAPPPTAQLFADTPFFEHISFEQGLFQSYITTLMQDSRGFLWIGTSDGLNRYDGYQFTTYRYDPADSTSISGNYIYSIYEDREGYLWIITSGGGLNCFDPYTGRFKFYHQRPERPNSLNDNNVTCLLEDRFGNFWLGTQGGGLNLLDRERDRFYQYKKDSRQPESLSNNFVSVIHQDSAGYLWIGTHGGGLNRLELPESLRTGPPGNSRPPLRFTHFYARDSIYSPDLLASIDSLSSQNRRLSSILNLDAGQEGTAWFELSRPARLLIVCMGEGTEYGLRNFGWLEREKPLKTIWQMGYRQSTHFGTVPQQRLQMNILNLPAGKYRLRYQSAAGTMARPLSPEVLAHPELRGIQVFTLSERQAGYLSNRIKQRIAPNALPHDWITALYEDRRGSLWVGTAGGLAHLAYADTPSDPAITTFKQRSGERKSSLNHNYINAIYRHDSLLWVTTPEAGINVLRGADRKIFHIPGSPATNAAGAVSGSIGPGSVSAFLADRNGRVWIGTGGGISRISRETNSGSPELGEQSPVQTFRVTRYQNDPANPGSLSNNDITAILEDRSGIIWIGTRRGGLNKLNPSRYKFKHITGSPGDSNSLSDRVVTAIYEERNGTLWIGTARGGLNRLTPKKTGETAYTYTHFHHDPADTNSLSHNFISAIHQDQAGNLWIGTAGGGLTRMRRDDSGYVFRRYLYRPENPNTLGGNSVNTIYEDHYGRLWIGTNTGLDQLDRRTNRFTHYRNIPDDPNSLSHNEVWAIHEDHSLDRNVLWIGTRAGGLNKFDRKSRRFIRYTRDFNDPNSLNNSTVLSIHQDRSGYLWFGTYSGGLNRFSPESEQFIFFTERDGLTNNRIFGILEDDRGNLWLSTNNGLSQFDPRSREFRNYDIYDGLQANEFTPGAYFRNQQGVMYFGGVNGFNRFQPENVRENPFMPPVVFTGLQIYGKPHHHLLTRALHRKEPLELNHEQNFLTIEFAALDYTNPQKNRYAYRLEGLHADWIDSGTRRFVSFTNLSPGTYVFRVKGTNSDGVWNNSGPAVTITIHPPFWRTWWFYLIAAILVISAGIFLHRYRLYSKLQRILEIEQVRSQENERVRSKAAHDFHDELGHKMTRIALFSEIVRRNLQAARPDLGEYLTRITDTAKSLSGGMRDFIWTLDPGKDTLHEVAVRLKDFGDELFDKTGVAFRLDGITPEMETVRLNMDWRLHLTLLFKEAMNNSLKHAACRNVTLMIALRGKHLEMTLVDDGKGLPEPVAGNGIQVTTVADQNGEVEISESPGNGLMNMQHRAESLNGSVTFHSAPRKGTRIRFYAPLPDLPE